MLLLLLIIIIKKPHKNHANITAKLYGYIWLPILMLTATPLKG